MNFSIFAVLVVCLSGVSADQIKGDGLASGTDRIRSLKDVLAYNGKQGEDGERRKLVACFATTEASACATTEASSEAASAATSAASNAASACAEAGATTEKSSAEYDAVYAAVFTAVYDTSIAEASIIKGCGVSTRGSGNTKCNRFKPVPFFYTAGDGTTHHKCCAMGQNLIVNDNSVACEY
jgi:hypothetical protein